MRSSETYRSDWSMIDCYHARACRLSGSPRVTIAVQEVQRLQQVIVNVGGMLKVQS